MTISITTIDWPVVTLALYAGCLTARWLYLEWQYASAWRLIDRFHAAYQARRLGR